MTQLAKTLITNIEQSREKTSGFMKERTLDASKVDQLLAACGTRKRSWRQHLRCLLALDFDAKGISIPFPQRDVHLHHLEAAPAGKRESTTA